MVVCQLIKICLKSYEYYVTRWECKVYTNRPFHVTVLFSFKIIIFTIN